MGMMSTDLNDFQLKTKQTKNPKNLVIYTQLQQPSIQRCKTETKALRKNVTLTICKIFSILFYFEKNTDQDHLMVTTHSL